MSEKKELIASQLLKISAVKLQPEAPFTWASGWKSPFYCDNRKALSYPDVRTLVCDSLCAKAFLDAAVTFADFVMSSGKFTFDTDFRTLFGSETKKGNETILYRQYSAELGITHCIASYANLDEISTKLYLPCSMA